MAFIDTYNLIIQNKYLVSIAIFLGFYIISQLVIFFIERFILRITAKTKTDIDDKLVRNSRKPIVLLLITFGLKLAINPLALPVSIDDSISKVLTAILIILFARFIGTSINILIDEWGKVFAQKTKSKLDDQLVKLGHKFFNIGFTLLAAIFVLEVFDIKVGPLLASLGIAGLAIAFALQQTLGNIFGGISLIIDKSIAVGDVIKVDDIRGKVLAVGLRSTKIRTFDNEVIIVPNGKLADSKIRNDALPDPSARFTVAFSVVYGSNIDKVKKTVLTAIKPIKNIAKDPPAKVMFLEMADFSLNLKLYAYVKDYGDRFTTKEQVTTAIYNALNKAKIGIPFPTQTIHLEK